MAQLIWLGIRMIWRANPGDPSMNGTQPTVSRGNLWLQGFVTCAANPKAIVFVAALFPQFIQADNPFWPQLLVLSATYTVIDGCFLSAYGFGASWVSRRFRGTAKAWIERIGGSFTFLAAVLLGLKSISRSGNPMLYGDLIRTVVRGATT